MDPSSLSNRKRKPTEPSRNTKEDDDRKHNHQNILLFLDKLKEGLGMDLFQQYCEGFRKACKSRTPFLASEESLAPFKDHLNIVQDFRVKFRKLDKQSTRVAVILLMLDSRNLCDSEVQGVFNTFGMLASDRLSSEKYLDYERMREKYFHDRINMYDAMCEEANRVFSGHDDLIYVFNHMIEFGFANRELVLNPVVLPEATDLNTNVLNLMRDATLFIRDQEGQNQDDNIDLNDFLNEARMECLTKMFKQDPYFPITEMTRKDAIRDLEDMIRRLGKKLQGIDRVN